MEITLGVGELVVGIVVAQLARALIAGAWAEVSYRMGWSEWREERKGWREFVRRVGECARGVY
jgi:hypothetical protein